MRIDFYNVLMHASYCMINLKHNGGVSCEYDSMTGYTFREVRPLRGALSASFFATAVDREVALHMHIAKGT